jgi:O-acetyl-ADP-ribose deacetylase (regulator of RNase III)
MTMLKAIQGDITTLALDAIANAANRSLLGGGGVDGAIHAAAGPELFEECRRLGGCATGDAKITRGYRLPAKFVIHTVGPIWRDGKSSEKEQLGGCYRRSLEIAAAQSLESIAFPCVGTGISGYPTGLAAEVAVATVTKFIQNPTTLLEVVFCCFSRSDFELYQSLLARS